MRSHITAPSLPVTLLLITAMVCVFITASYAQQIKGKYNPSHRTFFARAVDEKNMHLIHEYSVKKFYGEVGVAEHRIYKTLSEYPVYDREYGVIDTSGNVRIPFSDYYSIWPGMLLPGSPPIVYWHFRKSDSIGAISTDNRVVFSMLRKSGNKENRLQPLTRNGEFYTSVCIVHESGKQGIFSYKREKLLLPAEYENIKAFTSCAKVIMNGKHHVFEYESGRLSQPFDSLHILEEEARFIICDQGKYYVCKDIFDPWNTPDAAYNRNGIIEYYKEHFISRSKGMMGVVSRKGEVILPFEYDDIYFFEHPKENYFWVKKGDRWAIYDHSNMARTAFEFLDIDQLNSKRFENFIYLTQVDTSAKKLIYDDLGDVSYFLRESVKGDHLMLVGAKKLKEKLNRHIISRYDHHCAKKSDGYHLITIDNDSIIVHAEAWDDIYGLSPRMCSLGMIGVRSGKKYGYISPHSSRKPSLKFSGLYFMAVFSCQLYWSDRNVNTCPHAAIKGGYVFIHNGKDAHDRKYLWRPYSKYRPRYQRA